jgi:Flp pilus assembly protein CpaB
MKTQTIVILCIGVAVAFVCLIFGGLVASYLTSQLIAQKNMRVLLVVARHNYPSGTAINDPEEMFEMREFFASDAPSGRVTELEELRGRTLTRDISEGEPLLEGDSKLDPPGPGRKYLDLVVKARENSIRAGTRVDVILSKSKEDPKAETIVLHGVLVRTVKSMLGQEVLEKEGKTDLVAIHVVLDVSLAEGAQFVASVKESKSFSFELRPSGDNKKVDEKNSTKVP